MTLGVAVVGAVAGGTLAARLGKGFAVATHPGWWIITALGAVIVALGLLTTTRWADRTARMTAARLGERPRTQTYPQEVAAG